MLVTLFGMVMERREEHHEKVRSPILVTLFPMVAEVREEQSEKALSPILVTLLGITIEVSESNAEHKSPGMCSTFSPKVKDEIGDPLNKEEHSDV